MISRRTTLLIANAYEEEFVREETRRGYVPVANSSGFQYTTMIVQKQRFYDFLFENEYPPWLCNAVLSLKATGSVRTLVMRLHTGESVVTPSDTASTRLQAIGQVLLRDLARDILKVWDSTYYVNSADMGRHPLEATLLRSLELDGYLYRNGNLLSSESAVLDIHQEQGILDGLYMSLQLANLEMFRYHLKLSEEAYMAARWGDAIHNLRLVFEEVLREVAVAYSLRNKGVALNHNIYTKPIEVRQYLEREGLLDQKEREVIQHIYGLLSNTGSHPYMAEKDQARLLRHMVLTLSQFVILRLEGALSKESK